MATSPTSSFPQRLLKIDDLTRGDHSFLTEGDNCYYLGEYTARKDWNYSPTNRLIWDVKIPVADRQIAWKWRKKLAAIIQAAGALSKALGTIPKGVVFVPVPPSKAKNDAAFDDRMAQVLRAMKPAVEVRELVRQEGSRLPSHKQDDKRDPAVIKSMYRLDTTELPSDTPHTIMICDDMITTGCQFLAMKEFLQPYFPQAHIAGLFIARRAPEALDWGNFSIPAPPGQT